MCGGRGRNEHGGMAGLKGCCCHELLQDLLQCSCLCTAQGGILAQPCSEMVC